MNFDDTVGPNVMALRPSDEELDKAADCINDDDSGDPEVIGRHNFYTAFRGSLTELCSELEHLAGELLNEDEEATKMRAILHLESVREGCTQAMKLLTLATEDHEWEACAAYVNSQIESGEPCTGEQVRQKMVDIISPPVARMLSLLDELVQ